MRVVGRESRGPSGGQENLHRKGMYSFRTLSSLTYNWWERGGPRRRYWGILDSCSLLLLVILIKTLLSPIIILLESGDYTETDGAQLGLLKLSLGS